LLASASVGTLELRSAVEPVRNEGVQLFESLCTGIDFSNKVVTCKNSNTNETFTLPYDQLVIACGSVPNTFNIPGVKEYGNFLKEVSDSRKIRNKLVQCLEMASQPTVSSDERKRLLHWSIVGGGPTGVEFCAELYDFINEDVSRYYPHLMQDIKVSLYDVAPRILSSFDETLSKYATDLFTTRGISVNTEKGVKEVSKDTLVLSDNSSVPYGLLVWSAGLAPNDLIKSLPLSKDRTKRLHTNEYLQVLDEASQPINDVYAVGDCSTIKGYDLPPTAQVAKQKAEYLASCFNKTAMEEQLFEPFKYNHKGSMAYIGGWKAVVDMQKSNHKGMLGWFIWRSAYMSMASSWRNKIKIPTYWALTWLLGREISKIQ
jgi:NADH dehydrogenase FAD-containing subunit